MFNVLRIIRHDILIVLWNSFRGADARHDNELKREMRYSRED